MPEELDADLLRLLSAGQPELVVARVTEVRNWSESLVFRLDGTAYELPVTYYLKRLDQRSQHERVICDLASQAEGFPAPRGRVLDAEETRWLLVESVAGEPLARCRQPSVWSVAVRQLAGFHDRGIGLIGAGLTSTLPSVENLLGDLLPRVLNKTSDLCQDGTYHDVDMPLLDQVGKDLESCWPALKDQLLSYPRTLVHGDCHYGNLFMGDNGQIMMIDWGSAFIGPGLFDLVTLIDVAQRMGHVVCVSRELQDVYRTALNEETSVSYGDWDEAWATVTILRCLLELEWFARTGEDYGERVNRELGIIREQL